MLSRETLNLYIDGLQGLMTPGLGNRTLLVELAESAETIEELISEWLYLNDRGPDWALRLKLWFGLSYEQLGRILGLNHKALTQLLRNQRQELMGSQRSFSKDLKRPRGELSCFMVEQHLSVWLDCEWDPPVGLEEIRRHLETCPECRPRLESYRELQQQILKSRPQVDSISVEEWHAALQTLASARRQHRRKWITIVLLVLGLAAAILLTVQRQPDKMPNIYEIKEDS